MSAQKRFVATQPPADLLCEQLQSLGLYVMAERYQELAEEATRTKSPYVHYLNALVSAQLSARMERSYRDRLARARFPRVKTLEEFDFSFQLALDARQVKTLFDLHFLAEKQNVLLVGPPGVGKTHLSIAMGVRTCAERKRVAFYAVCDLLDQLALSHASGELWLSLDIGNAPTVFHEACQ